MPSIRRLWVGLALISAALIVHMLLYIADSSQTSGKSISFLALAGVFAVYALGVIAAAVWVNNKDKSLNHREHRAHRGFEISSLRPLRSLWFKLFFVVIFASLCFAFGFFMRPEWVYAHMGIVLGLSAALFYYTFYRDDSLNISTRVVILAALIFAGLITLVRLYSATAYPFRVVTDEPWVFSWAYSYLQTGRIADWLMPFGGGDGQTFLVLHAWWMRLVGIGWWEIRALNGLFMLPLIVIGGLAACNLYNRTVGWLTALFLFGASLVMSMGTARHDIGLANALAACLWLNTWARRIELDLPADSPERQMLTRRAMILHALSGMMIGLGWFAQYNATGFGLALTAAFYVGRWIRPDARFPKNRVLLFMLGGAIGASIVFVVQILPSWETFVNLRISGTSQSLTQNIPTPAEYPQAFLMNFAGLPYFSQFETLIIAIGVIALIVRRRSQDVYVLLCIAALHLILPVMSGVEHAHTNYVMPLSVFYFIAVAALFDPPRAADQEPRELRLNTLVTGAFVALIALGVTLAQPVRYAVSGQPMRPPPPPAAQWVIDNTDPEGETVLAQHWYFFWLYPYRFLSPFNTTDLMLPSYREQYPTDDDAWRALDPTIVIIDRNLSDCCLLIPPYDPDWLAANGYMLVAEVAGERVPVQIYRRQTEPTT